VTKFSTYPPETSEITNVGTFWQPDIEAVLMCRPTLIITLGFSQQSALAGQLEQGLLGMSLIAQNRPICSFSGFVNSRIR
jgi:ABC-type Fe3+-hydroxamate transport system substrate-binding protein